MTDLVVLDQHTVAPINALRQALANATTPQETKRIEEKAKANQAYAKECGDFEAALEYAMIYLEARRETTKLIEPHIRQGQHGRESNDSVTFIADYGFKKMQWERRRKELKATIETLEEYRADCIEKGVLPTPYGLIGFMSHPHVSFNSGENEWYTPPAYTDAARGVMGEIDLDPASSETANRTVKAKVYFTADDDGLQYSWDGRVWMNPPYSSELIGQFTGKLCKHIESGEITEAIVLVNNASETYWFQSMLVHAAAVCFIRGRVKFIDMDGNPSGAPLQGQAILYMGDKVGLFAERFGKFGKVLYAGREQRQDT